MKCKGEETEFYLNSSVAGTDYGKILSKRLVPNSSESLYVLPKWEKFLAVEHSIVIPFAKFLNFVSINLRAITLAAIGKTFVNCKRKYFGKTVKIGHGRNPRKECENFKILRMFFPQKFYPLS